MAGYLERYSLSQELVVCKVFSQSGTYEGWSRGTFTLSHGWSPDRCKLSRGLVTCKVFSQPRTGHLVFSQSNTGHSVGVHSVKSGHLPGVIPVRG